MNDTIAAVATPMTPSAIGILRLSGPGPWKPWTRCSPPFTAGR